MGTLNSLFITVYRPETQSLIRMTSCAQMAVSSFCVTLIGFRRGHPRSRQIWSPSPDRESSATHDGENAGRKSLVSLRKTAEPGVPLS